MIRMPIIASRYATLCYVPSINDRRGATKQELIILRHWLEGLWITSVVQRAPALAATRVCSRGIGKDVAAGFVVWVWMNQGIGCGWVCMCCIDVELLLALARARREVGTGDRRCRGPGGVVEAVIVVPCYCRCKPSKKSLRSGGG